MAEKKVSTVAKLLGRIQELQHGVNEGKAFIVIDGVEFNIKKWLPLPGMVLGFATLNDEAIGDFTAGVEITDTFLKLKGDEWWYDGLIKKGFQKAVHNE